VVQFDFPGGEVEAVVSGSWPFYDGEFHLFGKMPFEREDWYWFVQH